MHELFATQAILDKALAKAADGNADRITDLHLVVGEISRATSTTRSSSTGTRSARVPSQKERGSIFVMSRQNCSAWPASPSITRCEAEIRCPNCGSSGAKILAGEEFYLEALDVE